MSKPLVFTRRSQLTEFVQNTKARGDHIGLVPTMGALHEGHATLIRRSVSENSVTIATIFVNPKQFGPSEDFGRYPRPLADDLALLESCKTTAVFAPSIQEMYPEGFKTSVRVPDLSDVMCGSFRQGHFDGVCTVVLLLLNLASAHKAYFGLKDFQQFFIMRRMCLDLAHPTELIPVATVRESDGLAMSSRNRYLNPEARQKASAIPQALAQAAKLFLNGERKAEIIVSKAVQVLSAEKLQPQYLDLRDLEALQTVVGEIQNEAVLALAQPMSVPNGSCRLIDNIVLSTNPFYRGILEDLIARTT